VCSRIKCRENFVRVDKVCCFRNGSVLVLTDVDPGSLFHFLTLRDRQGTLRYFLTPVLQGSVNFHQTWWDNDTGKETNPLCSSVIVCVWFCDLIWIVVSVLFYTFYINVKKLLFYNNV